MRMTRAIRIVIAALALVVVLMVAGGPAVAQPTYPPSVAPTQEQPEVEAEAQPLAFTGADLTLLVGGFGILLAGGAVALIAARRRSRPETG